MTNAQLIPALIVPFIAWRVYRRFRRNVGRQPYRPARLITRIIFFSSISVLIGFGAMAHLPSLEALGGGLLLAVPLALVGLQLTRFETTPEGKFYTPNTAIGIALIVLFVGRIAYRLFALLTLAPTLTGGPTPQMFQSPLTLLIYGVTAGYYIAYYAGVLLRANQQPAA